eukprot:s818_g33.t2
MLSAEESNEELERSEDSSSNCSQRQPVVNKKFLAAALGNWLEWYDFGVYAAVPQILGSHFFPSHDPSVQIMHSFMAFAAGYVTRPLGGILIGVVGDRIGRKCALWTSMLLMMCPTFLIGCLPTYAHVGWLSTALLVVLRLLQGIAIGGEYVSALVFSMEHAPGHQKTISGALMSISVAVGTFSGFGMVALLQQLMSPEAMNSIGWRICFWLGLLVGWVGLFLRSKVSDPEEFVQARELVAEMNQHPLYVLWHQHRLDVLLMVGVEAITPAAWYQNFIWILQLYDGTLSHQKPIAGAPELNTVMQLAPSTLVLIIAVLRSSFDFRTAEAWRQKNLNVRLGMIWLAIFAFPGYWLITLRSFWGAFGAQLLFAIGAGFVAWGNPFLMHTSFPVHIRVVAMGISYNISAAIFGGPTPYICSELLVHFGVLAPALWLVFMALLSFSCMWILQWRQETRTADCGTGVLPAERLHMAQQAASYLEEHDLVKTFQEILHGLIVTKPADPHLYVEAHLAKAKKLAKGGDARMLCSAGETDRCSAGSPAGTELYKAKRRRSSVREHMRANQRNAVGCSKVEALLLTLEAASNNLELVLHLVPDTLRESISHPKFVQLCEEEFQKLDKEQRGELTSDDLLDVIVELSRSQKESISQVQCRKFAEMFDTDQDGLINISEFTQMVQFVTVASWLESEEGKHMVQKASLAERTFQDFIKMIEADKERLWSIIPFLPDGLVTHLTGSNFEQACYEQFDGLDVDKSGTLEPLELLPVIQLICQTEEHAMQMTEEKCRRFTNLFDTDGNGVIQRDEFIEFAQFLTVMNFLTNTEEGQSVNQKAQQVVNQSLKTDALLEMLEQDPDLLAEVLPHLPKPLYWELTSLEFNKACMDGFQAAAGEHCDPSTTVPPGMLTNVVYQLMQAHPFSISEEHCNHLISRWDKDLRNAVTSAEFLLLARYIIVMGFLNYQLQNQDTLVADSMLGSEKMESLLVALKKGSEMVWEILPFLPEALVDELSSDTFEQTCINFFNHLDKDSNGVLEPMELLPVVQELTQAHAFVLTEDHCKRFVDIFDIDRNGVIAKEEFVNFVRYMMIMSFMETPEGEQARIEAEVEESVLAVEGLLKQLARDRQAIFKVMGLLPEAIYSELVSQKFVKDFNDEFKRLDKDGSGVLEPPELFPVIVRLSQSKPFAVTLEQTRNA